jgi:hypothetical protein
MADPEILLRRLATVEVEPGVREAARAAIERAFSVREGGVIG